MGGGVKEKRVAARGEMKICTLLMLHCTALRRKDTGDQKWSLLEAFSDSCCKLVSRFEQAGRDA